MLVLIVALGLVGCLESSTGPVTDDPAPWVVTDPDTPDTGGGAGDTGDGGGSDPPPPGDGSDPPGDGGNPDTGDGNEEPPPPPPPTGGGNDPCGTVERFHAVHVSGGWWKGFYTGSPGKLSESGGLGINSERNATIAPIASIEGHQQCDKYLTQGRVQFEVTINADGLEAGGGGKHLVNIASTALSRASRSLKQTRVEIDNPATQPRFVIHVRPPQGGTGPSYSANLGPLPIAFQPDRPVAIDWTWRCDGQELTMTCCGGPSTRIYRHTIPAGHDCIGLYWGSGHMETTSGGGKFKFTKPRFSHD